jgi:hypothetical protein
MSPTEQEILDTLEHLEAEVKRIKTANPKPDLAAIFQKLDILTGQLGANADSSLLHYLHKKSYEKARLYLKGRDADNAQGSCRH